MSDDEPEDDDEAEDDISETFRLPPANESRIINLCGPFKIGPTFADKGWTLGEQDARSVELKFVNVGQICFDSFALTSGPVVQGINGKIRRQRLMRSNYIPLDARIVRQFGSDMSLIPDSWRIPRNNFGKFGQFHITFDGTLLIDPDGDPFVFFIEWSKEENEWRIGYRPVDGTFLIFHQAALLEG
jgi:hypothetical protein